MHIKLDFVQIFFQSNSFIIILHLQVVLAASSKFFANIFKDPEQSQQSFIVLKDISAQDFGNILQYIYHGEVDIPISTLDSVMSAAHFLKIRGLTRLENHELHENIQPSAAAVRKRKSDPKVRFLVPPIRTLPFGQNKIQIAEQPTFGPENSPLLTMPFHENLVAPPPSPILSMFHRDQGLQKVPRTYTTQVCTVSNKKTHLADF